MNCPQCNHTMMGKQYEGVRIDECSKCHGVWMDNKELGVIVNSKVEKFGYEERVAVLSKIEPDIDKQSEKKCPICNKPLDVFQYAVDSGVFINSCSQKHGIWLDENELNKVQIVIEERDRIFLNDKTPFTGDLADNKECPSCQKSLMALNYEGIEIDSCQECSGCWCDDGELMEIIQRHEVEFMNGDSPEIVADEQEAVISQKEDLSSRLACIYCDELMSRVNYQYSSGIIIDRCIYKHGIWLDKGELEKVQIYSERWDSKDKTIIDKYSKMVQKIKQEQDLKNERSLQDISVSRFGIMNRFMRSLFRSGLFS